MIDTNLLPQLQQNPLLTQTSAALAGVTNAANPLLQQLAALNPQYAQVDVFNEESSLKTISRFAVAPAAATRAAASSQYADATDATAAESASVDGYTADAVGATAAAVGRCQRAVAAAQWCAFALIMFDVH